MASSMVSPASSISFVERSSSVNPSRTRKWNRKSHICKTCDKHFSRKEHCARHERSHTHERPYQCRYCPNRYARKDLVSRHEKSLHANVYIAPFKQTRSPSALSDPLDTLPSGRIRSVAQHNHLADPNLEEVSNPLYGTTHVPMSPRSSAAANDIEFDHLEVFRDDIGLALHMPLSPIDIDLSGLASNNVFNHSNTVPTLSDQHATFDNLTAQSQSTRAEGGQLQDMYADRFATSHERLPLHIPDLRINDPEYFGIMPYSELSVLGNSSSTNDVFLINRDPPPRDLLSQESDQDSEDPQSRNFNAQINDPQVQDQACSLSDFSCLGKCGGQDPLSLVLNDYIRQRLLEDLHTYLSPEHSKTLKLPSATLLQRFVSSYQTSFHPHYPILHLASMDLEKVPSPLILAMCSIGALYRLERKHATYLQQWADRAIRPMSNFDPSTCKFPSSPLWVAQSKLLQAFGKVFCGSPAVARNALESLEYLSTEYIFRRCDLKNNQNPAHVLSWNEWKERETSKRLLCGIFALNSLVSTTFNTTPKINMLPDAEIELPHEDVLWEAISSNQWLELMMSRSKGPSLRVIDAVNHLVAMKSTESQDVISTWSSFARTIVMHAINVHIYHLIQCTRTLMAYDLDDVSKKMSTVAFRQAESVLHQCQSLFTHRLSEQEQSLDDLKVSHRSNGHAILRVAYVRACSEMESLNCFVLLSSTSEEMAREIQRYIRSSQKRTPLVTKTIRKALDGLSIAVNAGTLLVKKTAALKWSIDHAIADWNCALFVSRWIHTLECQQHTQPLNPEERQIFEELNELLSDAEISQENSTSFAADIIRLWADFFDDTWVWGITPRMGAVMRIIATVCETDRAARYGPAYYSGLVS